MPRILIVEDDKVIANGLKEIVHSLDRSIDVKMTAYAEDALLYAKSHPVDAFLLDIQLKDYDGIELAGKLREMESYKLTPMIFVTAVPTKELMAFRQLHCYDYIVKPFDAEDVREALGTIISHGIDREDKVLTVRQKSHSYVLKQKDVLFVEASVRHTLVVTEQEEILAKLPLRQVQKELSEEFVQCHRSYIVNRRHIKTIDKKNMRILIYGTDRTVPYSKKFKSEVEEL